MAGYNKSAGQKDTLIAVPEDEENEAAERANMSTWKKAWVWFKEDPCQRWPFIVFLLFGVLTVVWLVMYISEPFTGYLLAGIAAVIMSLYGANHFRILLGLKEQVDHLHKLNNQFRSENANLKIEVDKLTKSKDELVQISNDIRLSNQKLKEGLRKFQELDKHLKNISDDSIEGLSRLQDSSKTVMDAWKKNLVQHERSVYNAVMDQVEMSDGKQDLTKAEFDEFMKRLPAEYREHLKTSGVTFAKYAGDDNLIDFKEFTQMLDEVSEKRALD